MWSLLLRVALLLSAPCSSSAGPDELAAAASFEFAGDSLACSGETDYTVPDRATALARANRRMAALVSGSKPVHVIRTGLFGKETKIAFRTHRQLPISAKVRHMAHIHAGIYPPGDDKVLEYFASRYLAALKNADAVARWHNFVPLRAGLKCPSRYDEQDELLLEVATQIAPENVFDAAVLNPRQVNNEPPWTKSLQGKRILVVTAFPDEVLSQYRGIVARQEANGGEVTNDASYYEYLIQGALSLEVVAPALSLNGLDPDVSWIHSLHKTQAEIANKMPFDLALVSAGGYGLPLGDFIKTHLNKSAVYVGGGLQLYFQIAGNRWKDSIAMAKRPDSTWVCPNTSPESSSKIEGAAYWCGQS